MSQKLAVLELVWADPCKIGRQTWTLRVDLGRPPEVLLHGL